MDLRSYVAIIRKYLPLLVIAGLLGMLAGFALYKSQPKQYAADVQFYVSTPVADGGSAQSSGQFAAARMTSYAELLTSQELGDRVVRQTKVNLTPAQVAKRIATETTVESVLVRATVTDTDPQRALAIAKGLDDAFGPMVNELDNAGRKDPLVTINTVSAPTLRSEAVAPKAKMNLLLGLAIGLGLALAAALAREILDDSVKTPELARDLAGVPLIGTIPVADGKRPTLIAADDVSGPRVEAHRKLRTNLAFLDATGRSQVLLFTSPTSEVDTSTVAANTAVSFAEAGERVCLVGSNLRDDDALAAFGLGKGIDGLSGVLAGTSRLEAALTRVGGVDVMPSGELPPNPAALLGSARFADLLVELRSRYDRVVLDSPAVLPVADASVLAPQVDGVVLVTRHGATTADQLTEARTALETVRGRLVGLVVDRVRGEGTEAAGKRS